MPHNTFDDKSTLVQAMAWCHQVTSHYLSQYWPRSRWPCGVTRPQSCVLLQTQVRNIMHSSSSSSSSYRLSKHLCFVGQRQPGHIHWYQTLHIHALVTENRLMLSCHNALSYHSLTLNHPYISHNPNEYLYCGTQWPRISDNGVLHRFCYRFPAGVKNWHYVSIYCSFNNMTDDIVKSILLKEVSYYQIQRWLIINGVRWHSPKEQLHEKCSRYQCKNWVWKINLK